MDERDGLLSRLVRGGPGGESAAVHFLVDRQPSQVLTTLTREALAAEVERRASALASRDIGLGDAIVLALPTGPSFVTWFLAAMWVGAIPVPVPVPTSAGGTAGMERFESVLAHARPRALVADDRVLGVADRLHAQLVLLRPEDEGDRVAARAEERPDRVAFVQYTAGSTGTPKGVVVTFGNLRANLEGIGRAVRVTSEDRVLSWLPLYHDMGLVGTLLFSLYWELPLHLFSPVGFVLRPVGWLEAIAAHRATLSPAPHFAYSLCAFKLRDEAIARLDLSSWRLALDGAEPVRAANARAFLERFARNGLRPAAYHPVYGLSEATLAVALPRVGEGLRVERVSREALARGEAALAQHDGPGSARDFVEVVSVGFPVEGLEVEIRSTIDDLPLPERRLGEICVRGSSVSPRYYGEEGKTRDVLRTGDLGYLAGGALFVTDRIKDIIIQGGTNVYPTDVETAAAEVEGVRKGRVVAFGITKATEGTEEIVVAAEARSKAVRSELAAAIRTTVRERTGVVLDEIVLLDPGTLPLTTSGKLMRSRVREGYLGQTLEKHGLAKWLARFRRRVREARTRKARGEGL